MCTKPVLSYARFFSNAWLPVRAAEYIDTCKSPPKSTISRDAEAASERRHVCSFFFSAP